MPGNKVGQRNAAAYLLEATELFAQLGDRRNLAYALETWARMAVTANEPERAALFYAGAQQLRQEINSPLHPKEQKRIGRCFPKRKLQWKKRVKQPRSIKKNLVHWNKPLQKQKRSA